MQTTARTAKDAAAFVEVEAVDTAASGGSGVRVDLEGPQGARVRVLGGSAEAVVRVAAFLLKVSGS